MGFQCHLDMSNDHADLLQPIFFISERFQCRKLRKSLSIKIVNFSKYQQRNRIQVYNQRFILSSRKLDHRSYIEIYRCEENSASIVSRRYIFNHYDAFRSIVRVALIYIFMAFITGLGKYFWKEQQQGRSKEAIAEHMKIPFVNFL